MLRALLIRSPYVEQILDGHKKQEFRGSRTAVRGRIGLIASGSGTVIGVCDVVDCVGPLPKEKYRYYNNTYAWVLANPRWLKKPVPYTHPQGAVIWVKLDGEVEKRVVAQL